MWHRPLAAWKAPWPKRSMKIRGAWPRARPLPMMGSPFLQCPFSHTHQGGLCCTHPFAHPAVITFIVQKALLASLCSFACVHRGHNEDQSGHDHLGRHSCACPVQTGACTAIPCVDGPQGPPCLSEALLPCDLAPSTDCMCTACAGGSHPEGSHCIRAFEFGGVICTASGQAPKLLATPRIV